MATPLSLLYQRYDGANRLFNMKDDATGAETYLTYDGRNFLTQARQNITTCCAPVVTQSVYSSEGVLQGRSVRNVLGNTLSKDTKVFYFAGRPVGLLEMTTAPATLSYLSVDHLGTPILETNSSGVSLWGGGFEPFGKDWSGAQAAGEFLRFPGQWEDGAWAASGGYYNVNRWYEPSTGRYTRIDPIGKRGDKHPFSYARSAPVRFGDILGLKAGDRCQNIRIKRRNGSLNGDGGKWGHWWVEINGTESYGWWPKQPIDLVSGICGVAGELNGQTSFFGTPTRDPYHGEAGDEEFNPEIGGESESCFCQDCAGAARCIRRFAAVYSGGFSAFGQNCQSFQKEMMATCCLQNPKFAMPNIPTIYAAPLF